MAAKQPSVKDQQKIKQDIIAKQKAKDELAAAKAEAERAAELDKPMTEEEKALAALAAKGLQDGGSLTDGEVQAVSGSLLSRVGDEKTEEVKALELRVWELEQTVIVLKEKVDVAEKQAFEAKRRIREMGVKNSKGVGSIDGLGTIDELRY